MHKTSNEQALGFIDSFLGKIAFEKTAADPGGTVDVSASDVGGSPAGTVKAKVCCTDKGPEESERQNPSQGAFGREKDSDLADSVPNGQSAASDGAVNKAPKLPTEVTGNFGTCDASGASINKSAEEQYMANEMQRARRLGDRILEKVAAMGRVSSEEQLVKTAADQAYNDFVESFKLGLRKRAEDKEAIKATMGVDDAAADGMLDDIANEDPDSVLPADGDEGGAAEPDGDEGGEIPESDASGAPEGGTPDEGDAKSLLQDLIGLGIPPEVIEAAISELDGESPDDAAAAMEKSSALRKQAAQQQMALAKLDKQAQESYLRKTAAEQKVWFEKLDETDKQAFLMKTAAEQFENLKGVIRDFRAGRLK